MLSVINMEDIMGKSSNQKREVVDQSIFENSMGLLTDEEIDQKLAYKAKKCIYDALMKYENGPYASIFNEADMIALSQDIQMEVKRRVKIYQKDPTNQAAVNSRGMGNYYTTAFKNHLQKIYEKHAKTDSRAGVGTVSSDEALLIASSKNLIYPENHYLIMKEFQHVVSLLENKDKKYNDELIRKASLTNRTIEPREFSYNSIIIEKTLEGYSPSEIREALLLTKSDYAQKRDLALREAKECFAANYQDLKEHFDQTLDPRIYIRDVAKRLKKETRMKNDFKIRLSYYVENKVDKQTKELTSTLKVKVDFIQQEKVSKDLTSIVFDLVVETNVVGSDFNQINSINSKLLELKNSPETILKVQNIITNLQNDKEHKITA
jgi:hypothetical protein